MLEVKVEQCAGIDVGKKIIEVCVLIGPANRKPAGEVRRFGSNVGDLEALRAWLKEKACTEVVGCRKYKPAATRGGGNGGAGVKPWRHSFTYYLNSLEFRSKGCLLPGTVVRTRA